MIIIIVLFNAVQMILVYREYFWSLPIHLYACIALLSLKKRGREGKVLSNQPLTLSRLRLLFGVSSIRLFLIQIRLNC